MSAICDKRADRRHAPMKSLLRLGVRNFGLRIVTIGDNFQSSLETTALLKEMGGRFVIARASRDVHAKFLLRNGADDVIYPERQMATWAAVRYSSDHVFDYVELTKEYSIYETTVPNCVDWKVDFGVGSKAALSSQYSGDEA